MRVFQKVTSVYVKAKQSADKSVIDNPVLSGYSTWSELLTESLPRDNASANEAEENQCWFSNAWQVKRRSKPLCGRLSCAYRWQANGLYICHTGNIVLGNNVISAAHQQFLSADSSCLNWLVAM